MATRKDTPTDAPAVLGPLVADDDAPAEAAVAPVVHLVEYCRAVAEAVPIELLSVWYERERAALRVWGTYADFAARFAAFGDEPSR